MTRQRIVIIAGGGVIVLLLLVVIAAGIYGLRIRASYEHSTRLVRVNDLWLAIDQDATIESIKAIVNDSPRLVQEAYGGRLPVHVAALRGRSDVVKVLLENGSPVDARVGAEDPRKENTPLVLAVIVGSHDTALVLLEAGANVGVRDNRGESLTEIAKSQGDEQMVALLRQYGAKD